jgi:predicted DsbA family dithiol-disulfide isomerase
MKLSVDIWSDVVCPWCYIGKRRFEAALSKSEHAGDVEVRWHSFELDPSAPSVRENVNQAEHLAKKYRVSAAQAQAMIDRVTNAAAGEGLEFHYDRAKGGNTFDAHRLIHFAQTKGLGAQMKERLLKGYFTDGAAIGEADGLVPLAVEVGLPEVEVKDVLATDRYANEVRGDEALARELGISGVPFFVIGGRLGVSGAQAPEVLLGALERGWADHATGEIVEGAVCGPDGC